MKWHRTLVVGLSVALVGAVAADSAHAQRRNYRAAPGTTIQLPRFNTNAVTTTVTAPDGGTVLLGGIKSARESRNEYGVPILGKLPFIGRGFRNVGIGREVNSNLTTVTPYIHDFEAMERQLLGTAPPRSAAYNRTQNVMNTARYRARDVAREQFAQVERPRRDTIANKAAELRSQEGGEQAEAELYFTKARTAYRQGKVSTSRIYLRMAANLAKGDLREKVLYAQNAIDPRRDVLAGR
ncbi:MAG: type II and III secretion system protein [Pirellulales bacterium]|nr:type II and III secretion system protein [Pirellulales bacterium]